MTEHAPTETQDLLDTLVDQVNDNVDPETIAANLTPAEQQQVMKAAAEEALKSEHGWTIVAELQKACMQYFLSTRHSVEAILRNRTEIDRCAEDPEAFDKVFTTLLNDLKTYHQTITAISDKHQGKTGKPTDEEWVDVLMLTAEYDDLVNFMHTTIGPLLETISQWPMHTPATPPAPESEPEVVADDRE